jgi:hypothetical protein
MLRAALILLTLAALTAACKQSPPNEPATTCGVCPEYAPPSPDYCKGGTIVDGGKDACGCQQPPDCKCESCPQYVPPAPNFCTDGTIIYPEPDSCGCVGHPTCDRPE